MTQIHIQTAGLAFGGTSLCSYGVRGVDGSCAEHLINCRILYGHYLPTVIFIIIGIPSPTVMALKWPIMC